MIYLLIGLVALAIITKQAVFAWVALAIAILVLFSGKRSRLGYFSPLSGPINVEPLWFHCPEHGDVPINHIGRPTTCPTCGKQMEKGKKEKK